MRHNSNRRQRGRGNGGARRGGGQQRTQVFDSNGPEVRIRGTAHQVNEKYMALAKDAESAGDKVLAESYLQHAEHYQRIINSWEENAVPADKQAEDAQNAQEKGQDSETDGNRKTRSRAPKKAQDKSDLDLPASILGDSVQVESKQAEQENA